MSKTPHIIPFDAEKAVELELTGGKGASLARLVQAGFPVPPGFSIATGAYTRFMEGVMGQVKAILAKIDYANAAHLEEQTGHIRALIIDADMPDDIATAITQAYGGLDNGAGRTLVAVRSSGTAEDLADASFAGLHDTFLDVQGDEDVLLAVRKCWASLWTSRAVGYRQDKGFDHEEVSLSVVVQQMVPSEIAGVLFTANPLNLRTDEFVVNASWGLGESVVSGIVTPDEYIVNRKTLKVKAKTLGSKEVQIIKHPSKPGTQHLETPTDQQEKFTLSDDQVSQLADLGARVMEYYHRLPQDLEWGYYDGQFYLLQSRPVTGAEFTWDEDINDSCPAEHDEDTVWTSAWADDFLTGGLTPLFFSLRVAGDYQYGLDFTKKIFGFDDLAGQKLCKYRRATAFFNCDLEREWNIRSLPPQLRNMDYVPHTWDDEIRAAPFDWFRFADMLIRMHRDFPRIGVLHWLSDKPGGSYDFMNNRVDEANGPSAEELAALSDAELEAEIERTDAFARDWLLSLWTGFNFWAVASLGSVAWALSEWYDGENEAAYQSLISGVPETLLVKEGREQWDLAAIVRNSPSLRAMLEQNEGAAFFSALEETEEGRSFLKKYNVFMKEHGHRGAQDRDYYYKRRADDPMIDYRMFRAYLSADENGSPDVILKRMIAGREEATREVLENIRAKEDGEFKASVFQLLLAYAHKFLVLRDDERHYYDRVSYRIKKTYEELGSRMLKRGLFDEPDDFYFLCKAELQELQRGEDSRPLTKAKIAARKRVFHRRNERNEWTPAYMKGGAILDMKARSELNDGDDGEQGGFRGIGTAVGTVTGTARVVGNLENIDRVEKGDILITNSTDPGWTPVFAVISGLILETGGLLAHGACLAREYGLPSVLLRNAMKLIPDGARITINGSSGEVIVEDNADTQDAPE